MIFKEENRDLFSMSVKNHFVHCISADYKMGAGIAVKMDEMFSLRQEMDRFQFEFLIGDVHVSSRVFSLVTKKFYWDKPNYKSMEACLLSLRHRCEEKHIKYLAMPRIGCGLDGLNWDKVKKLIQDIFYGIDVQITVCTFPDGKFSSGKFSKEFIEDQKEFIYKACDRPWRSLIGNDHRIIEGGFGTRIGEIYNMYDRKYVVEACNNYESALNEIERLQNLLEEERSGL